MNTFPTDPDYLSNQEIERMNWGINLGGQITSMGKKYGIPQPIIDDVLANTIVLEVFKTNFDKSKTFYYNLIGNKNSLMAINPPNPQLLVDLTALPEFTEWPSGDIYVGILRPHLQAAELFLANKSLSATDKTLLKLDKLQQKPSTRPTAEDFNYPLMSYTLENNMIILRIKRGDKFKGKICRIMLDITGSGSFTLFTITTAKTVDIPVHIPVGRIASTMVIQAIYKNGDLDASDWSPWLVIPVQKSNAPDMEAMAA